MLTPSSKWLSAALLGGIVLAAPSLASAGGSACQIDVPCTTDADCGAGTRCVHDAKTVCVGTSGGSQQCAPADLCELPYSYSCNTDADCGGGFTCTLDGQECDCSGSKANVPPNAVSTPCSQANPDPFPPCDGGPDCPMFPSICDGGSCWCWPISNCYANPQPASCSSDGDCKSGWSCASGKCEPPCYGDAIISGPASGAGGGVAPGDTAMPGNASGGCSVVAPSPGGAAFWAALALGAAVAGARRRSRRQ